MQHFSPIDLSVLHFGAVLNQRMQHFSLIDLSVLHFGAVLNQRMQQSPQQTPIYICKSILVQPQILQFLAE